jgi:hypothetical protein
MAYSTKFLLALAISALLAYVVLAQPLQYDTTGALAKRATGVMNINLENMPVKRKNKDDDKKSGKNDDDDDDDDDDDSDDDITTVTTTSTTTTTSSASSSKKSNSTKKNGIKNNNPDLIYDFNVKQKKTDCLSDGRVFLKKQNKKADKKKSDKKTKKN